MLEADSGNRGAGFLGSHLCDRLIERGADVICADNFYTGARNNVRPFYIPVAVIAAAAFFPWPSATGGARRLHLNLNLVATLNCNESATIAQVALPIGRHRRRTGSPTCLGFAGCRQELLRRAQDHQITEFEFRWEFQTAILLSSALRFTGSSLAAVVSLLRSEKIPERC